MESPMDTVRIFDTTLRDGEQSPGATLTRQEKVEIARHLEQMGVDVIEAGFPIASDGDFESVKAIAGEIGKSVVCGLARSTPSRCSLRARRIFSERFMEQPGDCSPSRNVVSKIFIRSRWVINRGLVNKEAY